MKKTKAVMPNDLKKVIREDKAKLDVIVKQEITLHHDEYEDFVKRVEATSSWSYPTDKPTGLVEMKNLLMECIPQKFIDDYMDETKGHLADPEFRRMCIDFYVEKVRIEDNVNIDKEGLTMEQLTKTDSKGLLEIFKQIGKEIYISQARFDLDFIYNLYELAYEKKPLAVYTYYYMAHDHGYQKIAGMLPKLMLTEESGYSHLTTFRYLVSALVSLSTSLGTEDKKSWNEFAESIADESEELWKEIVSSLRFVIDNKGIKKAQKQKLSDMLVGDKEELLLGIEQFLNENKEATALAYLLLALERTYHIECPCFRTFCNAVNSHFNLKIGFRKGYDRYNEIKNAPSDFKNPKTRSLIKAKETIDTWAEIFCNCA